MKKRRCDKWERELFGWDDGDVYVFHEERGNFSVKRHPELHRRLVEMAIHYFEEHNAKSEEELEREGSIKYQCGKCGYISSLKREDVDAGRAKCKHCGSKSLKQWKTNVSLGQNI